MIAHLIFKFSREEGEKNLSQYGGISAVEIIPFYVDFSAERFCDDIPSQQLAVALCYTVHSLHFRFETTVFFSPILLLRAGKTSFESERKGQTCLLLDFCRTIIKLYW